MALTCPRCVVPMTEQSAVVPHGAPVSVDICPECRGLWLDAQKLALVCPTVADLPARKMEVLLVGRAGTNIPVCPRCSALPYEFALMEGMLVDFCPQCHGVWLDGDEYEESAFEPVAVPRNRERSPYRASAERVERRSEVNCQDCSRPTIVARSYIWEHGFLCHGCFMVRDQAVRSREVVPTGPVEALVEGLFALVSPPSKRFR